MQLGLCRTLPKWSVGKKPLKWGKSVCELHFMAFEEGKNRLLHLYLTLIVTKQLSALEMVEKVHGIFNFASNSQVYKRFFFVTNFPFLFLF